MVINKTILMAVGKMAAKSAGAIGLLGAAGLAAKISGDISMNAYKSMKETLNQQKNIIKNDIEEQQEKEEEEN